MPDHINLVELGIKAVFRPISLGQFTVHKGNKVPEVRIGGMGAGKGEHDVRFISKTFIYLTHKFKKSLATHNSLLSILIFPTSGKG
jgi:hypothetical protein